MSWLVQLGFTINYVSKYIDGDPAGNTNLTFVASHTSAFYKTFNKKRFR
jgi:hypothetical protein